jgi:hypothetical protein
MRPNRFAVLVLALGLISRPAPLLSMQDAPAAVITDDQTDAAVISALTASKSLTDVAITTSTLSGVVTITGVVRNDSQKELAELLVAHVAGVKGVVNKLTITAAPPPVEPAQTGPEPTAPASSTPPAGDMASDGSPAAEEPATLPLPPAGPPAVYPEINVDQHCRVLAQDRASSDDRYSRPHYSSDRAVCNLVGIHHTEQFDAVTDGSILKRTRTEVNEQTYLLHNVMNGPVVFVVHQTVPRGWHIDSVPQPTEIVRGVASFRALAQPDQTVKLHVGIRR